jgi:hypothetical protein
MGTAIQIEMALGSGKRFEDELQLLFMQSGKIDVWNKIKSRAAALDVKRPMMLGAKKNSLKGAKKKLMKSLSWPCWGWCLPPC